MFSQPAIIFAFIFLFGLAIGSFLNVVIARLPKMMEQSFKQQCREYLNLSEASHTKINLATPRSHCPHCETPIKICHNIPIFSFFLLKGNCAHCHQKISWQYPFIEFLTGVLFCIVILHFGFTLTALYALIFTAILIVLAVIDLKTLFLPDALTLFLLWMGLFVNLQQGFTPLSSAVWGAIVGYGLLWSVAFLFKVLRHKEGLGHGDFKMLAALGAWFGLEMGLIILMLAVCISLITSLSLLTLRKIAFQQLIPFGPFLAVAGFIALLYKTELLVLATHIFG